MSKIIKMLWQVKLQIYTVFTTFELDEIQNIWLIACMHNPRSCSRLRDKMGEGGWGLKLQGPKNIIWKRLCSGQYVILYHCHSYTWLTAVFLVTSVEAVLEPVTQKIKVHALFVPTFKLSGIAFWVSWRIET